MQINKQKRTEVDYNTFLHLLKGRQKLIPLGILFENDKNDGKLKAIYTENKNEPTLYIYLSGYYYKQNKPIYIVHYLEDETIHVVFIPNGSSNKSKGWLLGIQYTEPEEVAIGNTIEDIIDQLEFDF